MKYHYIVGELVVCPSGRVAIVLNTNEDGRVRLRYKGETPANGTLTLKPELLKPYLVKH